MGHALMYLIFFHSTSRTSGNVKTEMVIYACILRRGPKVDVDCPLPCHMVDLRGSEDVDGELCMPIMLDDVFPYPHPNPKNLILSFPTPGCRPPPRDVDPSPGPHPYSRMTTFTHGDIHA